MCSPKLEDQLCFRLYTASRMIIRLYKPLLEELNLTYPQYVTMLVLWNEKEIGFRQLSQKLHMQTGTLTPLIQRLEKLDYAKREKHPTDDRKTMVILTDLGAQQEEKAKQIPMELMEATGFSKEKYQDYKVIFEELIEGLLKAQKKMTRKK